MSKTRDIGLSLSLHFFVLACVLCLIYIKVSHNQSLALREIKPIWITEIKTIPKRPKVVIDKKSFVTIKKPVKQQKKLVLHHNIHQLAEPALSGKQMTALQQLLYTQIHQHYVLPSQAQAMQEFGTSIVTFVLKPTGHITALGIYRSSQFSILDQAALGAVYNAVPFRIQQFHLSKAQVFRIPIMVQ